MKLDNIKKVIEELVDNIIVLYKSVDNRLVIDNEPVNLNKEEVKRISLDLDNDFYFAFFDSVAKYRERLKHVITGDNLDAVNGVKDNNIFIESRLKNINSIFSKIYQYNFIRKEHGDVVLNKCINDLFGVRIEVPISNIGHLLQLLKESNTSKEWNAKIINASKNGYNAIHMYISVDKYSLRWEIQFWLRKHDKKNREAHAKYKQAYTNWETIYGSNDLCEVISDGNL